LPVIISGNVGAKDLVLEGINGFVIKNSDDAGKISEKIASLLKKETRIKMGQEAYKTALDNTWERKAKRTELLYEMLLNR
jgi:glycosyltransferase involved in cell wall biosynthesis